MTYLIKGDRVKILNDQDGATEMIGTVRIAHKTGQVTVNLPVGGFRSFRQNQLRKIMEVAIKTENPQIWKYETDEKKGICILANDDMQIKFRFEMTGNEFYDVLEIDAAIEDRLKLPVSVEGMADHLHVLFPLLTITAMGRAFSHGWISSTVEANDNS